MGIQPKVTTHSGGQEPDLSVIVRIVGGQFFLHNCLSCLVPQTVGRPIEIIVPYDSTVAEIDRLETEFPLIIFVDMGIVKTDAPSGSPAVAHELFDRRTAAGLRVARGRIVALLEDYGTPDPDWCEQVLRAHEIPHGVIGGAVEHKGKGILNWAVYLLDFGHYRPPLLEGSTNCLTDVNVSYKHTVIDSSKELWAERYNEAVVHCALIKKGITLWLRPQIVVREDRGRLSFSSLVAERFWWGRLYGTVRGRGDAFKLKFLYVLFGPVVPVILVGRLAIKVFRTGRDSRRFLLSLPAIVVLACSWSLGEYVGYVTGREFSR